MRALYGGARGHGVRGYDQCAFGYVDMVPAAAADRAKRREQGGGVRGYMDGGRAYARGSGPGAGDPVPRTRETAPECLNQGTPKPGTWNRDAVTALELEPGP